MGRGGNSALWAALSAYVVRRAVLVFEPELAPEPEPVSANVPLNVPGRQQQAQLPEQLRLHRSLFSDS